LRPFFNFFKNTLGCDDEIFSLFNEKPRTQNKQHFIFELEFPIKEDRPDLIVLNTKRTFDPYVDLKFKKKIYFQVNLGKLTMKIYLSKYVKFNGTKKKQIRSIG
jgi:hypothetical protein